LTSAGCQSRHNSYILLAGQDLGHNRFQLQRLAAGQPGRDLLGRKAAAQIGQLRGIYTRLTVLFSGLFASYSLDQFSGGRSSDEH
jgi:hypothetical protein